MKKMRLRIRGKKIDKIGLFIIPKRVKIHMELITRSGV